MPDYSSLVNFGYSTKQIVSYLRSYESTPEAIFENELVLAENGGGAVRLHYNLDKIVEETLKNKCKGQLECASYFSLCFSESSKILYCDEEEQASDREYVPKEENMVTDLPLVGQAFYFDATGPDQDEKCYISTYLVERLDGERAVYLDPVLAKRLFVADPKEPPYFEEPLVLEWYLEAG